MKKLFSFLILSVFILMNVNAQPVVTLTGTGVFNDNETHTLTFANPGTIDKVVVEAMAVFRLDEGDKEPVNVIFEDSNENYEVSYQKTEEDHSHLNNGPVQKWGYYSREFNDVDAGGITLHKNGQTNNIVSFVAYVYRNGSMKMYSEVNFKHAFIFDNGSTDPDPCLYNFTIPAAGASRDVHLTVPFSDLASGYTPRYAVVVANAGPVTDTKEYYMNSDGSFLNIGKITLTDVPGNVTEVSMKIYSPLEVPDGLNGDSFITGGVILTVEEQVVGCTLTQGYWKTHSEYGPAKKADPTWELIGPDTDFFLSGKSYIEAIKASPAGNAYYILAQQYIAAELNFLAGANSSAVIDDFNTATGLFETYTPEFIGELKGNNPLRNQFIELSQTLDKYNNGLIGPGHCDDGYSEPEQEMQALSLNGKVYPNPVKNNAKVSFSPVTDGNATIELYDAMGIKAGTLFNQSVNKNVPVNLNINVQKFKKGNYILIIQNGRVKEDFKVQILK